MNDRRIGIYFNDGSKMIQTNPNDQKVHYWPKKFVNKLQNPDETETSIDLNVYPKYFKKKVLLFG